jgi:hypothetical protein
MLRLRARRAVFDHVIDAGVKKERVKTMDDFMVNAPEDPLYVTVPSSGIDASANERVYTLEADAEDWDQREAIITAYASSVRARLAALEREEADKESARIAKAESSSGNVIDDLMDLPVLTDVNLGDSSDMFPSQSFYSPPVVSSLRPPPPMPVSFSNSGSHPTASDSNSNAGAGNFAKSAAPPPMAVSVMGLSFPRGEPDDEAQQVAPGLKPRRKYLKMERVPGQIELYKALEKALKELKDHKVSFFGGGILFWNVLVNIWDLGTFVSISDQGQVVGRARLLQHHRQAHAFRRNLAASVAQHLSEQSRV